MARFSLNIKKSCSAFLTLFANKVVWGGFYIKLQFYTCYVSNISLKQTGILQKYQLGSFANVA